MRDEFLSLVPKRYLCPYCGEWHAWKCDLPLNMCDYDEEVIHDCVNAPNGTDRGRYKLWFERGRCYYSIRSMCGNAGFNINDDIWISNIIENEESPIVTFKVPFSCRRTVSASTCEDCRTFSICNPLKLVCANDSHDIIIKLGFEFNQEDYEKISEVFRQAREKRENKLNQPKEENVMAMRLFNHKIEFGANTDKNIVSTVMGIAVNTGGSWRIYDKEK